MGEPKKCSHTRFTQECRSCRALREKWYEKLRGDGFVDIEYGRENPRFTTHEPDPCAPGAEASAEFYRRVWTVYHAWVAWGRTKRDCRVAELFAQQEGDTGTIRGIARVLKAEGLSPHSNVTVQATLREIRKAVLAGVQSSGNNVIEATVYLVRYHKAA